MSGTCYVIERVAWMNHLCCASPGKLIGWFLGSFETYLLCELDACQRPTVAVKLAVGVSWYTLLSCLAGLKNHTGQGWPYKPRAAAQKYQSASCNRPKSLKEPKKRVSKKSKE